jgi:hypothetical protein
MVKMILPEELRRLPAWVEELAEPYQKEERERWVDEMAQQWFVGAWQTMCHSPGAYHRRTLRRLHLFPQQIVSMVDRKGGSLRILEYLALLEYEAYADGFRKWTA